MTLNLSQSGRRWVFAESCFTENPKVRGDLLNVTIFQEHRDQVGINIFSPHLLKSNEYYLSLNNSEVITHQVEWKQVLRNRLLRTLVRIVPVKSVKPTVERWW